MSKFQTSAMALAPRLLGLAAAACLIALPACEPGRERDPGPGSAGNEVAGLSLALSASAAAFDGRAEPPVLTVVLRNATAAPAFVPGLPVVQGHRHLEHCPGGGAFYVKNDLRYAGGLVYVLRFADGAGMAFPHVFEPGRPQGGCQDGQNWEYGPVEVPPGGEKSFAEPLPRCSLNADTSAFAKALARCPRFCVVAVAERAGLRSNAVFFNGTFALPAGFDPIAEARAFRHVEGASRARREAGAVRP